MTEINQRRKWKQFIEQVKQVKYDQETVFQQLMKEKHSIQEWTGLNLASQREVKLKSCPRCVLHQRRLHGEVKGAFKKGFLACFFAYLKKVSCFIACHVHEQMYRRIVLVLVRLDQMFLSNLHHSIQSPCYLF